MALFRPRPDEVDQIDQPQQQTALDGKLPAIGGQERHGRQPPKDVLGNVGRMLAQRVGPVGDDAAMGEV